MYELREALRFCELCAMSRHPGCVVVAAIRLHEKGWMVTVDVEKKENKFLCYDAIGEGPLGTAQVLASLINSGVQPCDGCGFMTCLCNQVNPRDTLDERG